MMENGGKGGGGGFCPFSPPVLASMVFVSLEHLSLEQLGWIKKAKLVSTCTMCCCSFPQLLSVTKNRL